MIKDKDEAQARIDAVVDQVEAAAEKLNALANELVQWAAENSEEELSAERFLHLMYGLMFGMTCAQQRVPVEFAAHTVAHAPQYLDAWNQMKQGQPSAVMICSGGCAIEQQSERGIDDPAEIFQDDIIITAE